MHVCLFGLGTSKLHASLIFLYALLGVVVFELRFTTALLTGPLLVELLR
jgi:hypothetical protein